MVIIFILFQIHAGDNDQQINYRQPYCYNYIKE